MSYSVLGTKDGGIVDLMALWIGSKMGEGGKLIL